MRKEEKGLKAADIGILCSSIGLLASIALIVMNLLDGESVVLGLILLCACGVNLLANLKNKRENP